MFKHLITRKFALRATIGLAAPLLAASGCGTDVDKKTDPAPPQTQVVAPPPAAPVQLLTQTRQCTPQFDAFGRLRSCTLALFFNPNKAGSSISVEVSANLTDSRPSFSVADANNNVVAVEQVPVSNKITKTFVSQNTTSHQVMISELINPNSTYTVTVMEHP